jgi:membrane-associated HD superfamily phosphohydrolase
LANQCHRKERSSDVRCVPCGANYPANYKGCTVSKDLQKKTYPFLRLKQYTPPAQIIHTIYTQPEVTYAQITKQNSYAPTNVEQDPLTTQPNQETSDIQDIKYMMKSHFERMGTMLYLLTTVLTKLK